MAETNTSNIGFEKQIWDAACVLRGNIDASEYKSVVLGLIFLKYISDSMLRETVNLVNKRKEEGCIAVEMELAGVQAICDFYGFELYDFLVAGDVLIEGNYETDGLSAANHDLDKLFLALQIAKSV